MIDNSIFKTYLTINKAYYMFKTSNTHKCEVRLKRCDKLLVLCLDCVYEIQLHMSTFNTIQCISFASSLGLINFTPILRNLTFNNNVSKFEPDNMFEMLI